MSETNPPHFQSMYDGDKEVDILSRRTGDVLTILPLEMYAGARLKKLLGREYIGDDETIKAALETNTARKNIVPDEELTLRRKTAKAKLQKIDYQIDKNRKLCERFNIVIKSAQQDRGAYLQYVLKSMKLSEVSIGSGAMIQIIQGLNESCSERARPNQIFQVLKSALSRLAVRDPQAAEDYLKRLGAPEVNQFSLIFPDNHKNEERKAFNRLLHLPENPNSGVTMDSSGFHYDDTTHLKEKASLELEIKEVDKSISEMRALPPRTAIMPVMQLREMETLLSPSEDLNAILAEFSTEVKKILKLSELPEHLFSFELGLLVADRFKRQMVRILGRKRKPEPVIPQDPVIVKSVPERVPDRFRFDPADGFVGRSGEPIAEPGWEERFDPIPETAAAGISLRERFGPTKPDPKAYDPDKQ